MTFGNNSLDLVYAPDQTSTPLELRFTSLTALSHVATGEGWEDRIGGGVQVAMAEQWSQNRYDIVTRRRWLRNAYSNSSRAQGTSYLSDIPISDKPTKPFDWTYSTTFSGELSEGDREVRRDSEIGQA